MKLISEFKNIFTLNFLLKVKYLPSMLNQSKISVKKNDRRIFFLDAPDYANIGDQAISLAIRKFSDMYFPEYEFIEIMQKDIFKYINSLKKQIKQDDIIFLTGGGNMGNVYRIYEATRRFVIKTFPDNKIVIFPQTIDYTDDIFGKLSCEYSKKVYSAHKNLIICAREKYSYKKMKELYTSANVILCPDIVLSLNKCYVEQYGNTVTLCLRNDCEKLLADTDKEYIISFFKKEKQKIRKISTIYDTTEITQDNREKIVYDKLNEFAMSKLVVTDRLHAMIFCYLTNTPCIVFGNSNNKIKGVYKHIDCASYIKFLNGIEDFEKTVKRLNRSLHIPFEDAKMDFSELAMCIKEKN